MTLTDADKALMHSQRGPFIAHALHALTEADPEATILSIDGFNAFDLISRSAMLRGLVSVAGGLEAILFVRMFYGQPLFYIWEDDEGTVHEIHQEGGEQGDALMPLLFALGQHPALASVQERARTRGRNFGLVG